eukprot:3073895-Prorocentrum_lima.AAC.1
MSVSKARYVKCARAWARAAVRMRGARACGPAVLAPASSGGSKGIAVSSRLMCSTGFWPAACTK